MKKSLLLMAALFVASMGFAQQVSKIEKSSLKDAHKMMPVLSAESAANEKEATLFSKPRKSVANGCYYSRPIGTYYSFSTGATYLNVPAYGALFKNRCSATVKPTSVWLMNSGAPYTSGMDENNDLSLSFIPSDYVYYLPQITAADCDTFRLGNATANRYAVVADSIAEGLLHVDLKNTGFYSAKFSDGGYAFGSGDAMKVEVNAETKDSITVTKDRYFIFFDKPAKPFYLKELFFRVASNSGSYIADGVSMKAEIYTSPDPTTLGNPTSAVNSIGEKLATFTFTKDNIDTSYGGLTISNDEVDDYGNSLPVILTEPFVVVVSGFAQEGVDMGFLWTQPSRNLVPEERPFPTIYEYVKEDGTAYSYGWRNFVSGRIDHIICGLNGMWDVVDVDPLFFDMTAPVEGGNIATTEGGGTDGTVHYASLQFSSTLPIESTWTGEEGFENYYIDELPTWLNQVEVRDWSQVPAEGTPGSYQYNYGFVIEAEALPAGVEGRKATIRILSDKGGDSGPIEIYQGDRDAAGINGVTVEEKVTGIKRGTFNLAGQRVGKDYKGIVIENGKKIIRK